jgi:tungstate transport system substrate-binding protein
MRLAVRVADLIAICVCVVCSATAAPVRLALVNVPDDVLRPLLNDFRAQTAYGAEIVYTGNDPFAVARAGKADLVIAHYGHEGVEPFVAEGFGLWPHPVFANQMALLGPSNDPAHVRGLTDAAEALRRIARTKSLYLVNDTAGARYIEDILWLSAGQPPKTGWYLDLHVRGPEAARSAAQRGAYIIWGLPPFLRLRHDSKVDLEPMVIADSLFQRIMVSIIVNPKKVTGVNADGANAFQTYLLSAAIQARIRAFRYPDLNQQTWWPAGRHNNARE